MYAEQEGFSKRRISSSNTSFAVSNALGGYIASNFFLLIPFCPGIPKPCLEPVSLHAKFYWASGVSKKRWKPCPDGPLSHLYVVRIREWRGRKKGRARLGWKEGEENGESGESEKASNQTTMYRHRGRGLFSVVDVVRHRQAILIRGVPDV